MPTDSVSESSSFLAPVQYHSTNNTHGVNMEDVADTEMRNWEVRDCVKNVPTLPPLLSASPLSNWVTLGQFISLSHTPVSPVKWRYYQLTLKVWATILYGPRTETCADCLAPRGLNTERHLSEMRAELGWVGRL